MKNETKEQKNKQTNNTTHEPSRFEWVTKWSESYLLGSLYVVITSLCHSIYGTLFRLTSVSIPQCHAGTLAYMKIYRFR